MSHGPLLLEMPTGRFGPKRRRGENVHSGLLFPLIELVSVMRASVGRYGNPRSQGISIQHSRAKMPS